MTDDIPIACDMTGAVDTAAERLDEYRRLFHAALVSRERTGAGIVFRFRAEAGIEARVRDLAAREKACCRFFDFTVSTVPGEVRWDASVVDDDIARAVLDALYHLPETAASGPVTVHDRMASAGLVIQVDDGTGPPPATREELGVE